MTSPIIDFIEARLAEDEQVAQEASQAIGSGEWGHGKRQVRSVGALVAETVVDRYIARHDPARVLREVQAKRDILERESAVTLPEWKPDCGGDWVLSGTGFFANYWPDNTVTASITEGFDGPALADSGIVPKEGRAACQLFAEEWIRQHLPERSPILRALAAIWSDHPDFDPNWSTT